MSVKLIKLHFSAFKNSSFETVSTDSLPNKPAKKSVAIVMLVICPITRMVAEVPEARPNCDLFTELIIVFMFGDEKNANPSPTQINTTIICQIGVVDERNAKTARPIVHIVIPRVARYRG